MMVSILFTLISRLFDDLCMGHVYRYWYCSSETLQERVAW